MYNVVFIYKLLRYTDLYFHPDLSLDSRVIFFQLSAFINNYSYARALLVLFLDRCRRFLFVILVLIYKVSIVTFSEALNTVFVCITFVMISDIHIHVNNFKSEKNNFISI